jgi:hypothetical protein
MEHCTVCHQTFSGTTAGDRHRVGDHAVFVGPDRRRCLSADEMRAKGMEQNARGVWTNGGINPFSQARVDQSGPNSIDVGSGATEVLKGAQNHDAEARA